MNENLCRKLNLPIVRTENLILNAFESDSENVRKINVVKADIKDIDGNMSMSVELHVVPKICSPISQQTIEIAQSMYNHLIGLKLSDSTDGNANLDIQVLIGGDQYWNFVTGKTIRSFEGPVAMETFLGWVLSGPVNIATQAMSTNLICSSSVMKLGCRLPEPVNGEKTILTKINEFWETENLGLSGTERLVVKEFQESISFDGNNYHVRLPWKCDPDVLPDNFTCVNLG